MICFVFVSVLTSTYIVINALERMSLVKPGHCEFRRVGLLRRRFLNLYTGWLSVGGDGRSFGDIRNLIMETDDPRTRSQTPTK